MCIVCKTVSSPNPAEFHSLCPNGQGLYYEELQYSLPVYHGKNYNTSVTDIHMHGAKIQLNTPHMCIKLCICY